MLLQISGAAATLDKLLETVKSNFDEIEKKVYPAIERLEGMEKAFQRMRMSQNGKQREELTRKGYTILSGEQSRMLGLVGEEGEENMEEKSDLDEDMSEQEMEALIEEDILTIAQMDEEGQFSGLTGYNIRFLFKKCNVVVLP